MKDIALEWYNFRTGKYESHTGVPDRPSDYISQSPAAQRLYNLYVDSGTKTPEDAMLEVLKICAGVQDTNE